MQQRRVGYMFQDYALFPNMSVRGNLEFALRKGANSQRVDELIELMALGELQQRKPDYPLRRAATARGAGARTGCRAATVAAGRTLFRARPRNQLRLQDEVLRLQRHFGLTTVMVSHDVERSVPAVAAGADDGSRAASCSRASPAEVFGAGQASGKFSFAGEVLAIEAADVVFAVTLLVGNQIVRVIATADEAQHLKPGDRVMLMSKAFNPVLVAC